MRAPGSHPVVCDAGPLLVLAKLHQLYLLKSLYGYVHIPEAVYEEAVTVGLRRGYVDVQVLHQFLTQVGWKPVQVSLSNAPTLVRTSRLDRGEKEVLALAFQLEGADVLMDETLGREVARQLHLSTCGSLGVLMKAYRQGLLNLEQLRLNFDEIERRKDIWINPALVKRLLQEIRRE